MRLCIVNLIAMFWRAGGRQRSLQGRSNSSVMVIARTPTWVSHQRDLLAPCLGTSCLDPNSRGHIRPKNLCGELIPNRAAATRRSSRRSAFESSRALGQFPPTQGARGVRRRTQTKVSLAWLPRRFPRRR